MSQLHGVETIELTSGTPLERAVRLGMATDKEIALLTEWERYSVLISRIDTSNPLEIAWPDKPEQ